jgi:monovalent cation:H+ antiporter-2, CPA2 family
MSETAPIILDLGLVLLLAALFGWIARRVGLPAVVGYLLAGLAVSPFTPGYVADSEQITLLADIGVVILLFEVGIEVDVRHLGKKLRPLFWAAPLQVVVTTAASALVFSLLGLPVAGALLVGLGIALSSSVVIVNITRSSRRTTDLDTERALLGWSVLQDIAGVAAAAIILALFDGSGADPAVAIGGLVLYLFLTLAVAQIIPRLLKQLQWERDHFLIVSVAAGLAIAAVGAVFFGVPMALAAFVAGLVISDNKEMEEARAAILPFRDVFAVLFFVAVGTLINPLNLGPALPFAFATIGLVVCSKVLPAYLMARVSGIPGRPFQLAVGLGQIGEFSFVLATVGLSQGVIPQDVYTGILCAVIVTISGSAIAAQKVGSSEAAKATIASSE